MRELPPDVLSELMLNVGLAPLWQVNLCRGWHDELVATDASPSFGFGVAAAPCPRSTVRLVGHSSHAKAGANMFTFHAEISYPMWPCGVKPDQLIKQIHDTGMDAGMVINPPTPAEVFLPYVDQVEMFLIMSVIPGASGGAYIPKVLQKAAWLKPHLPENVRLEIDGGLNPHRAPAAVKAGIDVIVSASAIFGSDDRAGVIDQLKNA